MAPAVLVGMQHHRRPIGVVEGHGGLIKLVGQVPTAGGPVVPHVLGEGFALFAHGLHAPFGGHEPVVPVQMALFDAEGLLGVVRAIAHRQQHHVAGDAGLQATGIGHGTRTPVMAYQHRLIELQRPHKVHHVPTQGGKLPSARRVIAQKRGGQKTAQSGCNHPVACSHQQRCHLVPAAQAVGPTVGKHDGACPFRVPFFVANAQQRGFCEIHRLGSKG